MTVGHDQNWLAKRTGVKDVMTVEDRQGAFLEEEEAVLEVVVTVE